MADYIAIDGGTTNTRIALVSEHKLLQVLHFSVGAGNGIQDADVLRRTIRDGIRQLLAETDRKEENICRILASGMITSEFGLVELPHLLAPVGIRELHDNMYETLLEDISSIPFVFTRGVKTTGESLAQWDMLRGEETELMGICRGEGVYVLPGSHSKHITVDSQGRIAQIQTMLTGEMIAALCEHTILKDAVDLRQGMPDAEYLREGCLFAKERGLNQALFKVRILKNLFGKNVSQVYSFFLGAILWDEVQCLLRRKPQRIFLGGKRQLRNALAQLLGEFSQAEIVVFSQEEVDASALLGLVKVYEYKK